MIPIRDEKKNNINNLWNTVSLKCLYVVSLLELG